MDRRDEPGLAEEFARQVAKLAGCPPGAETLALLHVATWLGAATAAERNLRHEAPAHWRSLLAAALLAPDPASRWLQGMRHAFDLGELWPTPAARAEALRRRDGPAPPAGSEQAWFSPSVVEQLRIAGEMAAPAPTAGAEASNGPAPDRRLLPMHLIGATLLRPAGRHAGDAAIGRGGDGARAALRGHVARWLADCAFAVDRGWHGDIRAALREAGASQPPLRPELARAAGIIPPDEVEGWRERFSTDGPPYPVEFPGRGWLAAGPLGRLRLARMAQPGAEWPAGWGPLLDLLEEAAGPLDPDDLPGDGGQLAGWGHTLLARAGALATRVCRPGATTLPLDLHHLIGAAFAPEAADLPPAFAPFPAFRPGMPEAARQDLRRRFLDLVAREHAGHGRPERRSAWADLILGERLVTARIATDLQPDRDLLGFRRYADAFASVIADRDVRLPLAIGLFGPWGSGKSSMIAMIDTALGDIDARAALDEEARFCRGILRVTFNAWHYAETNLWASLFVRVMEQMAQHLRESAPAGPGAARDASMVALEAAREDQRRAEEAVAAAEAEAVQARAREKAAAAALAAAREAERTAAGAQARAFEQAQAAAATRIDALGLLGDARTLLLAFGQPALTGLAGAEGERLEKALRDQGEAIAGTLEQVRRLPGPLGRLRAMLGWRRPILLGLALAAGLAVAAVVVILLARWSGLLAAWMGALASLLTLLATLRPLWTQSRALLAQAPAMIDKLATAAEQVKARAEQRQNAEALAATAAEAAQAEREKARAARAATEAEAGSARAAEADRAVLAAQARAEAARTAATAAAERVAALAPDRLLGRFVAERAASEEYGRTLGLPTRIRRDLEDLRLRLADLTSSGGGRRADRVVLLIDDLDRCSPDVVVKVLEAVHILLSSDLFVVVVGVDVRWLRKALETHHAGQFGSGGPLDPEEFLEKIFQVPFWIPGLSAAGREAVVQAALPEVERTGTGLPPPTPAAPPSPSPSPSPSPAPAPAPVAAAIPMAPLPTLDPVRLRAAEQAALLRWGALAGDTPRRLKRFARSYLILRASLPADEREAYLDAGAYDTVARLLALNCAEPGRWGEVARFAATAAEGTTWPDAWLAPGPSAIPALGAGTDPPSPAACRPWLSEVERFGFAASGGGDLGSPPAPAA